MYKPIASTVPRRQLGQILKRLREREGYSLEIAAPRLEISTSALSRIERAQQGVTVHLVKSMLDLYNEADLWEDILDLTRRARQKGWWQAYGVTDHGYTALETEACLVRDFTVAYVPGLLQTEDYARAIFRTEGVFTSKQTIEQQVAARMIRQQRLHGDGRL